MPSTSRTPTTPVVVVVVVEGMNKHLTPAQEKNVCMTRWEVKEFVYHRKDGSKSRMPRILTYLVLNFLFHEWIEVLVKMVE